MTVCPITIVAGCRKCPAFGICPLKSVLGDHKEPDRKPAKQEAGRAHGCAKPKR